MHNGENEKDCPNWQADGCHCPAGLPVAPGESVEERIERTLQKLLMEDGEYEALRDEARAASFLKFLESLDDADIKAHVAALHGGAEISEGPTTTAVRNKMRLLHRSHELSCAAQPKMYSVHITQETVAAAAAEIWNLCGERPRALNMTDLLFDSLANWLADKYKFQRQANDKGFKLCGLDITHTLPVDHKPGFMFGF